MGIEEDKPPEERLIECFRPFLETLAASGKSHRTIQEHVDNKWALGGEFITELYYDPPLRERPVDRAQGNDPLRRPGLASCRRRTAGVL
jgi:hypothetical protein